MGDVRARVDVSTAHAGGRMFARVLETDTR